MNMTAEQRLNQLGEITENVCDALRKEVFKMGLPVTSIDPDIKRAEYTLSRDPGSGEESLIGIWRDQKGNKQGEILFHFDGSFYAEYDVISEHPKKPQWFVEAVTAWGRDKLIKSEAKLLPSITD